MAKSVQQNETQFPQAIWALWMVLVIFMWGFALVVFPAQLRTSMVYILLGLIGLFIYMLDKDFTFFRDFRIDLPVNIITWDNFKWRNILIGLGLAIVFIILSKITNAAYVGIPTSVGAFTFDRTAQVLYVASVGIVENAILVSFPLGMVAVLFAFLMKSNFSIKNETALTAVWFIGILIGSFVSAFIAVQYHQVVYANQTANLSGIGLLFFTFALATGLARDSSIADIAHTAYNFALVFLAIVPLAVAII